MTTFRQDVLRASTKMLNQVEAGSAESKLSTVKLKTETVMKTVPVVMGTRTFRFAGTHTKNRLKIQMMEQKVT